MAASVSSRQQGTNVSFWQGDKRSEGLGPGEEGQNGSEVVLVRGMTLHIPQKLPVQVSHASNSHPALRTPGAIPSTPSCRILPKSERRGSFHRLLSLLEALITSDYRKTLSFSCLLSPRA